jgi:hypothetical protein
MCVVVGGAVQDDEIDRWSEANVLVWPVQPRPWCLHHTVFILGAFTARSRRSVSSWIFTVLYRLWVLLLICFVLVFILSFDVCIVTITWSRLFLVISLWVICLTRWITLAILSSRDLPTLVCFLIFHRLMRKHLVILTDMVSECITFSEAPCLAWKCGTRRSDSPVGAL